MFNTLLETTGGTAPESSASVDWGAILGNVWNTIVSWCLNTGIKILIAIIILIVSFKIINSIARKIEKKGDADKFDKTVMRTLAYIFRLGLKIAIGICLVAYLGIDTSGLTALVASFGVCIGLAVNGALSNVAGGVLILVTRPFKIDDFIEAQGVSGVVEDIHMVCTKLRTPDNKVVYLPNGALSSGNIINYSEKDLRRVDFTFSIGYSSDYKKAQQIIMDIITSHELTLDEPAPMVRMSSHSASSIDIVARVWVNNADYWTVNFDVLEAVKAAFDENGIEIPFNQLDVHVKND
ncbi:MAG: mechanosensitive ion channel [Clostridia bacterium]|nr:mechanosensitive ion channel [Clostridia bacterium]